MVSKIAHHGAKGTGDDEGTRSVLEGQLEAPTKAASLIVLELYTNLHRSADVEEGARYLFERCCETETKMRKTEAPWQARLTHGVVSELEIAWYVPTRMNNKPGLDAVMLMDSTTPPFERERLTTPKSRPPSLCDTTMPLLFSWSCSSRSIELVARLGGQVGAM